MRLITGRICNAIQLLFLWTRHSIIQSTSVFKSADFFPEYNTSDLFTNLFKTTIHSLASFETVFIIGAKTD